MRNPRIGYSLVPVLKHKAMDLMGFRPDETEYHNKVGSWFYEELPSGRASPYLRILDRKIRDESK